MGVSFCTVFESDVPPHGTLGSDHPIIMRRQRQLDRLAADNGLTPLGAFESYEPDDAPDFLDEDALAQLPPVEWFDPAAGLTAVNALLAYLAAHPDAFRATSEVVADLTGIAAELADAARAGARFRFAIVP